MSENEKGSENFFLFLFCGSEDTPEFGICKYLYLVIVKTCLYCGGWRTYYSTTFYSTLWCIINTELIMVHIFQRHAATEDCKQTNLCCCESRQRVATAVSPVR